MKTVKELLIRKRTGQEWTSEQVSEFVRGVVDGSVSQAQTAAFLMASCINGLSQREVAALTISMAETGERVSREASSRPRVDKHSTGGVGDKVSILLAPLVACCGVDVPMISGRGLGHTGGTVDKLESVPGMTMTLPMETLNMLLNKHGLFMAAQTPNLAPADRIMYALRDVTGTVESTGLITASILSKKIAENLDGLVMDIKVGSAAFMTSVEQARELAQTIRAVAALAGLPVHIVFSRMDKPLGKSIGNWIEVAESEALLQSVYNPADDLSRITVELAAHMLVLAGKAHEITEGRCAAVEMWNSRRPHAKLLRMLERQGGDFEKGTKQFSGIPSLNVFPPADGYLTMIHGRTVAEGIVEAGGGRKVETDSVDPWVGIEFLAETGELIRRNSPVAKVTGSTVDQLQILHDHVIRSIEIGDVMGVQQEPIIESWT